MKNKIQKAADILEPDNIYKKLRPLSLLKTTISDIFAPQLMQETKMNRLTILIVLLSALILSCKSSSDVLPKQKMEKVLWDVARSSEFLNSYVYFKHPEQNRAALNDAMLERTLKIHKVTKQQFLNTLEHYKKRPDEFKVVVDSIISKQKHLIESDTLSSSAPGSADSLSPPVTLPQ